MDARALVGLGTRRWRLLLTGAVLGSVIAGLLSLVTTPTEPPQFTVTSELLLLSPATRSEVENRIEIGQQFTATASYVVPAPYLSSARRDRKVRKNLSDLVTLAENAPWIPADAQFGGGGPGELLERLDVNTSLPSSVTFSLNGLSADHARENLAFQLSELMIQASGLGIDVESLTPIPIRVIDPIYPEKIGDRSLAAIRTQIAQDLVTLDPATVMNSGEVIGQLLPLDYGENTNTSVLLGPVGEAATSASPAQRGRVTVITTDQDLSVATAKMQETVLKMEEEISATFTGSSPGKSLLLALGSTSSPPSLVGEGFAIFGGSRVLTNMLLGMIIGLGCVFLYVVARESYRQSLVNMSQD